MHLKINFSDFWPAFEKENNFFYHLLSRHFEVSISEDPDILFFSCYGKDYLKFDCIRIFYSSENMRPDFTGCDFAMSFDYLKDPRHLRLPLYGLYIEQRGSMNKLLTCMTRDEALVTWRKKTKFCCMVVSNSHSRKRIDFFKKLSDYRQVDSGGRFLNNVGGPVANKEEFIDNYKFVIAFENSSHPGYTTEKILDPFSVRSIPVYWGNPLVGNDFNGKGFLNYDSYENEEALIRHMLEIEANEEMAVSMLMEPVFPGNRIPEHIEEGRVLKFLRGIIEARDVAKPVARTSKRIIHAAKRKGDVVDHYIKKLFKQNFR